MIEKLQLPKCSLAQDLFGENVCYLFNRHPWDLWLARTRRGTYDSVRSMAKFLDDLKPPVYGKVLVKNLVRMSVGPNHTPQLLIRHPSYWMVWHLLQWAVGGSWNPSPQTSAG
jgi:hypothetical protein